MNTDKIDLKKIFKKGLFIPTDAHNAVKIKILIFTNGIKIDINVHIESNFKQNMVFD